MTTVIHQWKRIALIEEPVKLPNGLTINHTSIQHPGASVILPVTEQGEIIMVNQFRPSLKKWLLELPAGTLEQGEDPLTCAVRELKEETGYEAKEWISLGQVTPLAGFCDEIQYLYLAKGAFFSSPLKCDEDEIIEVQRYHVAQLQQHIIDGTITDAKTIACLSKARLCGYLT